MFTLHVVHRTAGHDRLILLAALLGLSFAASAQAQEDAGKPGDAGAPDGGIGEQDASPDAGEPGDAGAPDGEIEEEDASPDAGERCGEDPPCNEGLTCISINGNFRCGECWSGDERECDGPCGPGVETCQSDLFFGTCLPTVPVECLDGESLACEGACGAGHRICSSLCRWSEACISDSPADCSPGMTYPCGFPGSSCPGEMTCNDDCSFGQCIEVEDCPICGDGDLDDGEECDDGNFISGDGCSADCGSEEFRSLCDCRSSPGAPGGSDLPLAIVLGALVGAVARRADKRRSLR